MTKRKLFLDLETYSETPITSGVARYAEDPELEILLFAYAYEMETPTVLDLANGDELPEELRRDLCSNNVVKFIHNAPFDRTILDAVLGIYIPNHQIFDTLAWALSHALPAKLDTLCKVTGVPLADAKKETGVNLIQLFCKPRPASSLIHRATSFTHPTEWANFIAYAGSDITAMQALVRDRKIPTWSFKKRDREMWELDQRINSRGFAVDLALVDGALHAIKARKAQLKREVQQQTGRVIESSYQRDKFKMYLEAMGVPLPDLTKSTLSALVNDPEIPEELRQLIGNRLQTATTSTAKYNKLKRCVSKDGRLRNTMQYRGARTGRFAGRLFQPQNLPRPVHKDEVIEEAIQHLKDGVLDMFYTEDIMDLCAGALRGCIIAKPGYKLYVSDWSNIEGRLAAWCTGEDWKVQKFNDYDDGTGADLYVVAYAKAFNVSEDSVTKDQRQVGKVLELGLQYGGGVGAFLTFAEVYNLDLDYLAELTFSSAPSWAIAEGREFLQWSKKQGRDTFGLPDDTFVAMDALKRMWRKAHPCITRHWKELEIAALNAIETPNREFVVQTTPTAPKFTYIRTGSWLRCVLPSGRSLSYPLPRNDDGGITYMGMNTGKWRRLHTYGGKLFENNCQAMGYDIMADRMFDVERMGFDILLTVHDELITEAPVSKPGLNLDLLNNILAKQPEWCKDLPLAAAGFTGERYRKD